MKLFAKISFAILIACGISNACNKPSTFGSDILPDEDNVDIRYTDTISMRSATVRRDSIITYSSNVQFLNNLCGEIDDPVFGKSYAQVFSQLRLGPTTTDTATVNAAVLDSTVMRVAFSTQSDDFKRHYFDFNKFQEPITFGIGVYRLDTPIDKDVEYYSNATFPIGEFIGSARVTNLEPLIFPGASNLRTISFSLGDKLWNDLTGYSNEVFRSNVKLQEILKGVAFVPRAIDINGEITGMASLNFNAATSIVFHFHRDSFDFQQVLTINSSTARTLNFQQEKAGTVVEQFSLSPELSDSLVFVQGMEGWDTRIDFPYLEDLGEIAVNSAKLELTVHKPDENYYDLHPSVLIAAYENNEGNLVIVEDLIGANGGFLASYGGIKEFDFVRDAYVYSLDITKHFQRLIEKDFTNTELYISAFNKQESAARVILGGAGNTTEGMKLKLTYTKL